MNAPKPEHIDTETTIETLALSLWDAGLVRPEHHGHAVVEHLLTECVDDILDGVPAAAMIGALARRGGLTEEARYSLKFGGRIRRRANEETIDAILAEERLRPDGIDFEKVTERRLVTQWEVAP